MNRRINCIYCFFMLLILASTMFFIDVKAKQQQGPELEFIQINLGIYNSSTYFGAIVNRSAFL
jgi:hypothetical protein